MILTTLTAIGIAATVSLHTSAAAADASRWAPLIDVVFDNYDLEPAVLTLINDNNVPVSNVIQKARDEGFADMRIVDALIETKLSCEQVMIKALRNGVPPSALFDSAKIRDDYGYTPEKILRFLVGELRFMERAEQKSGEKAHKLDTKAVNIDLVLSVCESLIRDEDFSQYNVMYHLCRAEASGDLIVAASERFDVPPATTIKACPKHAEYGQAYISHSLPQEAHIIIGVDHKTLDDSAGRGVISPKTPR